jgi:hypothetical protein
MELFCSSLVLLSGLSVTRRWLLCCSSPLSRWLFCGSSVAPMRLLCGSSKAPVAPLPLPLRLFCGSSGLLCGSLVLLGGFSVTRLWLFCCSSPPYRRFLCGFSLAPMWLLCGSSVAPLWLLLLLCGFLCGSSVDPLGSSVALLCSSVASM